MYIYIYENRQWLIRDEIKAGGPDCGTELSCLCDSDSGRGSSLLDRAIADRRQLNAMTLPDFSDPETGTRLPHTHPQNLQLQR